MADAEYDKSLFPLNLDWQYGQFIAKLGGGTDASNSASH
jgi:hypothetical protein